MTTISLDTFKPLYDRVRPYLPHRTATYQGVETGQARLFDRLSHPNYKQGVVDAIREHADGNHIEIVGFGWGITTTIALQSGATEVTAYEAADSMIDIGVETLWRNDVDRQDVTLFHALIEENVNVFGSAAGARRKPASELGCGDVLVLDCEGAEDSILSRLEADYETIIVETHPDQGTRPKDLTDYLRGFSVQAVEYEPGHDEKFVLVATQ